MGTAMWKGRIETSKMGRVKHVESPSVLDFIPRDRSWGATEKVSAGESDEQSLKSHSSHLYARLEESKTAARRLVRKLLQLSK